MGFHMLSSINNWTPKYVAAHVYINNLNRNIKTTFIKYANDTNYRTRQSKDWGKVIK